MPSAMDFKRSSLTLQPNLFQLFQPIGGVRATPLSHALASVAANKIARTPIARMTAPRNQVSVFIFMPPRHTKPAPILHDLRAAETVRERFLASLGMTAGGVLMCDGRRDHFTRQITIAPAANSTADTPNAVATPNALHRAPTSKLEAKSPTAFTAANVPNAMPCWSRGTISAATESSSASSVPIYRPANTKIQPSSHNEWVPEHSRTAVTTAN